MCTKNGSYCEKEKSRGGGGGGGGREGGGQDRCELRSEAFVNFFFFFFFFGGVGGGGAWGRVGVGGVRVDVN